MTFDEEMVFRTKRDARRVWKRLHDHSILSRVVGREVRALRPSSVSGESLRDLMRKLVTQ